MQQVKAETKASRNVSVCKRRRLRQCRKLQDSIIVGATHVMRTARTHTIKNRAKAGAVAFASILVVFLRFVGRRGLLVFSLSGGFSLACRAVFVLCRRLSGNVVPCRQLFVRSV